MGDPCPADEATHGDDRVGEVEECGDHLLAALVAALEPVEVVVPGIGPFYVPTLAGLDRRLLALVRNLPAQPEPALGGRGPSREEWARYVAGLPGLLQGVTRLAPRSRSINDAVAPAPTH